MILDAFGRPTRGGNTFHTPDWLVRDVEAAFTRDAAEQRVLTLRHSVVGDDACGVGATIRIKLPDRWGKK